MEDGKDFPESAIDSTLARPPLRFRRFGGGYRREDVELLLAEMRLTYRAVELELANVRGRTRDLEHQLRESRLELELFRERGLELARAMTNARMRAEKIERDAHEQATQILAEAEAESLQRLEALGAQAAARRIELDQIARARDELVLRVRDSLRDLEEAIGTIEAERPALGASRRPLVDRPPSALPPAPFGALEFSDDELIFTDHVELDAGPFAEFNELSAFEQDLAGLPNVQDVHVRRYESERALIEIRLSSSAPLVAAMREHLSYSLWVRGRDGARLLVDVEPSAEPL